MEVVQRLTKKRTDTEKSYTIRLEQHTLDGLTRKAKEKNMSINLYLNLLLLKDVEEK